jgi:toxin ParE1/3/4
MSSHAVVLTPDAERQLADLYRHIADQSGVSRAEKFVGRILAECMSLSTFPERGIQRDDIRPNLRNKSLARRVMIAYSVDPANRLVAILGVFYGGQAFDSLLRDFDEKD